jgi:toxin YoeB
MNIVFREDAWHDYVRWQQEDRKMLDKINGLMIECIRHPFTGTGKPEPLRQNLKGFWSRRINREHRLVYRVREVGDVQQLEILSCRYHY